MKTSTFTISKLSLLLIKLSFVIVFAQNNSNLTSDVYDLSTPIAQTTITLKVLLVEFSDIKHRNPADHNKPEYTYNDFEDLFFSKGIYVSPNRYSPDEEQVFGSLHDYFNIMSDGKLNINGLIINNDNNSDGVPDWLELNNSKAYYQNELPSLFYDDVIELAREADLKINGLGEKTKLVVVYAGHMYRRKTNGFSPCGLTPRAAVKDNYYVMSEQFAPYSPYKIEHSERTFSHIGVHAHELSHLLGCRDHDRKSNNNQEWDLMGSGCFNGPFSKGECPSPLNPYYRWSLGWINIDTIKTDGMPHRKKFKYSLRNPEVFRLKHEFNKYFLVEYRKFDSYMKIGEYYVKDYNSFIRDLTRKEGMLVWRAGYVVQLIHASGVNDSNKDGHIFPGTSNVKVLTPWSDNRECKVYYFWLPNTKTSLNCGMEIISDEPDNYEVVLYESNIINASPSKPKRLVREAKSNVKFSWESNCEPDIKQYKIYKKKEGDSGFEFFGIADTNHFVDHTEIIDTLKEEQEYVSYYITACDNQSKESVPSSIIEVQVVSDDVTGISRDTQNITNENCTYKLHQNYPNPFNPTTTIKYSLPSVARKASFANADNGVGQSGDWHYEVTLKVYDMLGREVTTLVNAEQRPGNYEVNWDSADQASGVYFYNLSTGSYSEMKKMVLLR